MAVVVVNAGAEPAANLSITAGLDGRKVRTAISTIPGLSVAKVPFELPKCRRTNGEAQTTLELSGPNRGILARGQITLRVRGAATTRKVTFRSEIDGSVQYYAVTPSSSPTPGQALFLSLHGASVEAIGQAESYSPKSWGTIAAPTNRRPYGFDWEEWGRWDALEVLGLAERRYAPAADRIYLTGHSMGGHGTWNLGAHFPGKFAAIGPSAGWISFWSYTGSDPLTNGTPMQKLLRRAAGGSDTEVMAHNYAGLGVYVLHGDADDNVPVTEAREMRRILGAFHRDVDWHEQPGAGHWWDDSEEPGASCVDYAPMFDFFAKHRLPAADEVRRVDFTTVNPGVSAAADWVEIWTQEASLAPSRVQLQFDPGLAKFSGTTTNVAVLHLTRPGPASAKAATFALDGGTLTGGAERSIWLVRRDGRWTVAGGAPSVWKNPERAGLFREGFRHRMLFVHGTSGTPEENAWAKAKAQFDAEAFWYRGNASPEVIPDAAFTLEKTRDRGVVLYGHRGMNRAWGALLAESPLQVDRGVVSLGGKTRKGDDLACLFVRPRPDSKTASVAVIAGTGAAGMRTTNRLPYFMAGPGYPDVLVLGADAWERGLSGIRLAGFFGPDWSVERGDFVE
jgi:dienelactone hydrolase